MVSSQEILSNRLESVLDSKAKNTEKKSQNASSVECSNLILTTTTENLHPCELLPILVSEVLLMLCPRERIVLMDD